MARKGVTAQVHPGLARHLGRTGKAKRVLGHAHIRKSGKLTLRGAAEAIASATMTRKPEKRLEQPNDANELVQRDVHALFGEIKQVTVDLRQAVHEEQEARDGQREYERQ